MKNRADVEPYRLLYGIVEYETIYNVLKNHPAKHLYGVGLDELREELNS